MTPSILLSRSALLVLAAASLLAGCERPRPNTTQWGYRGTGEVLVTNPRLDDAKLELNQAPDASAPAAGEGPKAGTIYQNVKVLGDVSVGEFTRTMLALTAWVAPAQGCEYCHNTQNLAEDSKYTKVVARRMLQMTRAINADWKTHVAGTGVTCYTCHRGQNVPANVWFSEVQPRPVAGVSGEWALQNHPKHVVGLTALPYDPFTAYLLGDENIRIAGQVDDSTGRPVSTQHAEKSYGLMIHMSNSLGVNCTFCHNTRNFSTWDGSTPQRMTAWYGIRMVRALNNDYLVPLTGTFPESRLGPGGDVAKVYCNTCHNGVSKPLYGAAMAKDYPALAAPATVDTAAAAQAKQP